MDFFFADFFLTHSISKNIIRTCLICLLLLPAFVFFPTNKTNRTWLSGSKKVFLKLVNKLKDYLLLGNGSRDHRTGEVKPAGMWQLLHRVVA